MYIKQVNMNISHLFIAYFSR